MTPKVLTKIRKPTARARGPLPTSADIDLISEELRYAGDRAGILRTCEEVAEYLHSLQLPDDYWDYIEVSGRAAKKNFAQRLSNALAQKVADALRPTFPGILPDEFGRGQETKARAAAGAKKLDVAYAMEDMGGLGLAVSIKTINFRDEETGRYTKNVKRVDGELRAEAQDCHRRQPFAYLAALILLPLDSANDGVNSISSLKHAAKTYRNRSRRRDEHDEAAFFELAYLGLYESSGGRFGRLAFLDVADDVPDRGVPQNLLPLSEVLQRIATGFRVRNRV